MRACLRYAPAERLSLAPDCGLSQTARWAAKQKLANMVAGVRARARGAGAVIEPALADDAFLADVEAARGEPGRCTCGGSGRAASWSSATGRHLLLDPYLSDSLTRKYADTDKPHVRMTGA